MYTSIICISSSTKTLYLSSFKVDLTTPDTLIKLSGQHSNNTKALETIDLLYQKSLTESKIDQPDIVIVDMGPGSFTGIRIAAAFAKGLAINKEIKIKALTCLDAICYEKFLENSKHPDFYTAKLDARNGNAFTTKLKLPEGKPRNMVKLTKASQFDILGTKTLSAMAILGLWDIQTKGPDAPETIAPIYGRPVNITPSKRHEPH